MHVGGNLDEVECWRGRCYLVGGREVPRMRQQRAEGGEYDEKASRGRNVSVAFNKCMFQKGHTEVSRRPGSPNDARHEMSSLPNAITLPGVGTTRKVGIEVGIMV